jgi:peptide/nickel transport system substrate-binding protein
MSGRADWIWRVPQDQAEKMAKMPKITVDNSDTMRVFFLQFDAVNKKGRNSPVNKLKVRQAISHAIDKATIQKTLVKGASRIIHSACYPSQFGCTDDVLKYEYDPAKAKKLLAEAGYPNGFGEFTAGGSGPRWKPSWGTSAPWGSRPRFNGCNTPPSGKRSGRARWT